LPQAELCDGCDQAAVVWVCPDDFDAVIELYPEDEFREATRHNL